MRSNAIATASSIRKETRTGLDVTAVSEFQTQFAADARLIFIVTALTICAEYVGYLPRQPDTG